MFYCLLQVNYMVTSGPESCVTWQGWKPYIGSRISANSLCVGTGSVQVMEGDDGSRVGFPRESFILALGLIVITVGG